MRHKLHLAMGVMGTFFVLLLSQLPIGIFDQKVHLLIILEICLLAGNTTSLLLYTVPILTFVRVIKKKSTEEFSCVPYIISLFNCLLFTWYGLPVVSCKWENFLVVSTSGIGILLEFSYIAIYFWYAPAKNKKKAAMILTPGIVAICITMVISAFVFHDHHHRKIFIGSVGLLVSATMYGSPLVVMKQVIVTKSVEFMPFYLSLFSFLASSFWMAYGLVGHDLILAAPSMLGSPLGFLQLVLYFKYRKGGVVEEPKKGDLEKDGEKSKQLQPVINDSTDGKS